MPEVHSTPSHAGKVGGFLQQSTAGLPNWAWLLVIGGGIAAAYLVPKLFGGVTGGSNSGTSSTAPSGLGLAIDPTTGLPYATEGLVPSGGLVGGGTVSGTTLDTSGTTTGTASTSDTDGDDQGVYSPPSVASPAPAPSPQKSAPASAPVPQKPAYPVQAMTRKGTGGITSIVVRSGPYGSAPEMPHLGLNAPVTVTGPAILDASNVAWYPIKGGGYVYGYDLVFPQGAGSTGPRPVSWPENFIRSRHFRVAS